MKKNTSAGPPYLFGRYSDISGVLAGRKIALFLDFDGTLVPIQKDPAVCVLPQETKKQLQRLANSGRHYVTVLSGRALEDIKSKVGVRKICYGGNHGLAISGNGMRFVHPGAFSAEPVIGKAELKLRKKIGCFKGAWVEKKKFTLSLHYRSVDKDDVTQVKKVFYRDTAEFTGNGSFTIMKGKKVLELMPNIVWNKGTAVLWILERLAHECLPIFIGDDITDEAAFRALKSKGITIRIGKAKNTLAGFYLKNYKETLRLLKSIT